MNISQSIFPNSGIEPAKFITLSIHLWLILDQSLFSNNLTFSSDLECLVKFSIHLSFLSDLESAKFSIHFSILLDVESFIKFSNHLAFISDLEVGQIRFISHFYQTWFSATNYHLLKSFCNEKESGFRFNSFANNNRINIIR